MILEHVQEVLRCHSIAEGDELDVAGREVAEARIALDIAAGILKDNKRLRRMLCARVVRPKEQFYCDDGELRYTSACGVSIDFVRDEVSGIRASLEKIGTNILKEAFKAKEQNDISG